MDKRETKVLIRSLRLIIVGIFFWIFKIQYISYFLFPDNEFFKVFTLEIIGTIMILIATTMISSIYPFAYTRISRGYCYFILVLHILHFFLYKNPVFKVIELYNPFFQSFMLYFVSKTMQHGLKYFGSVELARKWRNFAVIMFFGICGPYFTFTSLIISGFVTVNFDLTLLKPRTILLFTPLLLTIISCVIYYTVNLVRSFRYLWDIQAKHH